MLLAGWAWLADRAFVRRRASPVRSTFRTSFISQSYGRHNTGQVCTGIQLPCRDARLAATPSLVGAMETVGAAVETGETLVIAVGGVPRVKGGTLKGVVGQDWLWIGVGWSLLQPSVAVKVVLVFVAFGVPNIL